MNKYFISIKFKWLIAGATKLSSFAHAHRATRLAVFGFAMLLLGFPAYAGDQYLLVSNREGRDILRYDADTGAFVDVLVAAGSGGMNVPFGMTIGPNGNLYVASLNSEIFPVGYIGVLEFDSHSGEFLNKFSDSEMATAADVAFGPDGNLYVTDLNGKIFRFDGATGESMGIFATGHPGDSFVGLAWDPDGNLYVSTELGHHLDHFDGVTGASLGTLPTPEISLSGFMTFGPDGLLYVSDYFGASVYAYDITTDKLVASFGGLNGPEGLAFSDDGDLLVPSYFSNQIVKFEDGSGFPGTVFTAGHPLHGPIDLVMTPVPEASTYAMLLAGLGLLGFMARRRKQNA